VERRTKSVPDTLSIAGLSATGLSERVDSKGTPCYNRLPDPNPNEARRQRKEMVVT